VFASPIVTTLESLTEFFPAEQYHQDYVRLNPTQGYVVQQALPKVEKAKKAAAEMGK
jgi:peptide-methionine (S)-S-oxide reductase